ncbi:MAG TPA: TonB-dependent receptor plug domain-containing protein [Bacteroidales bacterium]|nr:TonB-dependent receptor plug domain-containing protein [Bacteroidales bacterium]
MNCKSILLFLALICPLAALNGQKTPRKITITGTVLDANKNPVTGAVIFVDNIKTEVKTDQRGFYRIRVNSDAEEILVFTLFNGVAEQEIKGRRSIDFMLVNDADASADRTKTADDESVNVGYGAIQKKDMTTQSQQLDTRDPAFASYQTIYDMIRGRFPGVEVSGKSIRISGASSLNVSTEPLFVVDGVIVNSIDEISPQNVKSIEVLKGPAATAYGTRGSNGVIVITRMTGKDVKR